MTPPRPGGSDTAGAGTVVVIGAGIIGLASALRLAQSGHAVTVIDRQLPGRGCSFGNAGRIATEAAEPLASPDTLRQLPRYLFSTNSPLAVHPKYALFILPWLLRFAIASRQATFERGTAALRTLLARSQAAMEALVDSAQLPTLLKQRGHLLVSESANCKPLLIAEQQRLRGQKVTVRYLDQNAVRQLAPELTTAIRGGLYFPDTAHVVDPWRLCRGLATAIERAGGQIVRADVREIQVQADGSFVLGCGEKRLPAGKLVVAAGAWSAPLARQLGHRLPLDTERGYHLSASGWESGLRMPVASLERHAIVTPMNDFLRITGFVEFGGLQLPAVAGRYAVLRQHLQALVPGAELSSISEWMGHRPSMPDHLPVIGRCRQHRNAVLAFGHQHLGLTLSGITAEIVAALIQDEAPPVPIEPFRPERFRWSRVTESRRNRFS